MLNIRALAVAVAILWGGAMMLMGWIAPFGYGREMVDAISTLYIGYGPGFVGGVIGGIWGAVDGGIGGWLFGWLYNWLLPHFGTGGEL